MKSYPKSGAIYTLAQIENALELDDTPSLYFPRIDGKRGSLQTSHLTREELLSVPGMAESEWQYMHTTEEWIPCFTYVGSTDPKTVVDAEPVIDTYFPEREARDVWITPKGFPRKQ